MAIPTFLSNGYNGTPQFADLPAVTDVSQILTQLVTTLVTNLGWTQPVGNTFKSPPQADGTFLQMAMTRVDQFTLQMVLTDQVGRTICTRRIAIDNPGPTEVRIFAGLPYCLIESMRASGTWEPMQAWIIEPSPALLADITNRVVGNGYQAGGGGADGQGGQSGQLFYWNNGSSQIQNLFINKTSNYAGSQINTAMTDPTGREWFLPADIIMNQPAAAIENYTGRLPNVYIGDSTVTQGTDKTIPIDTGTSGVFQRVGLGAQSNQVMYIRKS